MDTEHNLHEKRDGHQLIKKISIGIITAQALDKHHFASFRINTQLAVLTILQVVVCLPVKKSIMCGLEEQRIYI